MIYDIAFERIGRRRDVPTKTVDVGPIDLRRHGGSVADVIAEHVHVYAKNYLASRYFEVVVDLEKGTGYIFTGQPAGDFTVTARAEVPS